MAMSWLYHPRGEAISTVIQEVTTEPCAKWCRNYQKSSGVFALITPCNRVLPEKQKVAYLVNKFLIFNLTQLFITVYTRDCQRFLYLSHINSTRTSHVENTFHNIKTPWPQSASELYRQSDRRLSAKIVPTFAGRGCCVVSVTNSHGL
jgi:hypothetical protein